ncbi:MAG TPA: nucleotide exchange factor GrpE [Bacteroidales bacterium]|nr:MAG: nucleotide exchange factor GrpE [Bacteroidetes bacterium GWF2_33_38]OFY76246.1 MAG: nucleotide exchange factor GrpE [Bacteroidetes bacterium RIFOXYA12_FULL_33_9]OFY85003.1 MAG: nucleotide exchange factor GrpE [Bacteroidetes bacterium RIFOXYA2_FULL_33_7]HBF87418.1 nucleotide exchange factor GrpE [Bacteroidales bacterium]
MSRKKDKKDIEENVVTEENEQNIDSSQEEKQEKNEVNIEAELIEKVNEFQNKYLRLSAEFDNYRKRTLKEKMDLTKTAGEDIFVNMLPIIDDFERAIESINSAKDIDAIKNGINLIYSKFSIFLSQKGIKAIETKDADFDTDFHEAITKMPTEDKKGKIIDVIEKGYLLNEKVIRYAKVVVGE